MKSCFQSQLITGCHGKNMHRTVKFALQLLEQQLKEHKNGKSLFQNLALKYFIRNGKENRERLKFNVAHHLFDCVVDAHLL